MPSRTLWPPDVFSGSSEYVLVGILAHPHMQGKSARCVA